MVAWRTPLRPHRNSQACQRSARSVDGEAVAAGPGARHAPPSDATTWAYYVDDLPNVVDIAAIREAGVRIGADLRSAGPAWITGVRSPTGMA